MNSSSTMFAASRLASLMALATLLGTSSTSLAVQPLNGVVSGLSVVWSAANTITIQPGEAYAAGHQFTMAAGANVSITATANQALYVYLCFDTHTGAYPAVPWVVTTIVPTNDGIGAGVTLGGDACDAVFLGSIVSDFMGDLVPFVRSGEEVILALDENTGCTGPAPSAGKATLTYVHGGAVGQALKFDSVNTNSCNGTNNGGVDHLVLPYPQTASAALVDFQILNSDNISYYVDVSYNLAVPSFWSYQLMMYAPPSNVTQYYPMNRINPLVETRVNNNGPPAAAPFFPQFEVGLNSTPSAGTSVTVSGFYRGYVESIGHLTQE